jgi:deazaflavin-dependent oxidoreductase (nitroreductase family)
MTVKISDSGPSKPIKLLIAVFNLVFVPILRSPLYGLLSNSFVLLSYKGRKSGKQYTILVGYQREGDELTVVSAHNWWKNLRAGNVPVQVLLHGKWREATASASRGEEPIAEFQSIVQKFPNVMRMYHIERGVDGQLKAENLQVALRETAVVRIRLKPEQ